MELDQFLGEGHDGQIEKARVEKTPLRTPALF
jgi:hypothetical protein